MTILDKYLTDISRHANSHGQCDKCKLDNIVGGGVDKYPYNASETLFNGIDETNSNSYAISLEYVKMPKVVLDKMRVYLPFRFENFQQALDHANKNFPELKFMITGSTDTPHFYDKSYQKNNTKYSELIDMYNNKNPPPTQKKQSGGGKRILDMDIDQLKLVLSEDEIKKLYEAELVYKRTEREENEKKNKIENFVNGVISGEYTKNNTPVHDINDIYKLSKEDHKKINRITKMINGFEKNNLKVKKI